METPDKSKRIRGELNSTGLPMILARAAARAPRGVLTLTELGIERKLYLREQRILFASSTSPADFLAERAVRKGLLTGDQVREALAEGSAGRRIGSILVKLGHLTEEQLVELLIDQIRSIVSDCFVITEGRYELAIGELPTDESITLDEPVGQVIAREVRKVGSLERAREASGGPNTKYFPVKGWRERLSRHDLGRDKLFSDLADLISGSPGITIRNIVVSLPRSEAELLRAVWILRALEIIGSPIVKGDAAAEAEAEPSGRKIEAAFRFAEALATSPEPEEAPEQPAAPIIPSLPTPRRGELPEGPVVVSVEDFDAEAELDLGDFDPDRELDLDGIFPSQSMTTTGELDVTIEPPSSSDPATLLERILAAAEEEVDVVLALETERASLSGDFAETPFAAVLRGLCRDRSTGTLICKRDEEEKSVTLDRGRPVFATTNAPGEKITERLVSEGLLSPSDLLGIPAAWPSARRIGGILLALRLVAPDVLRAAIRRQVADIIASLYSWNRGGYFFQERDRPPAEDVILDLSLPELALRGAQRIGDSERLVRLLGGREQRLKVGEDPSNLLQEVPLASDECRFLMQIGTGGTVGELVERGPLSVRAATVLLFMLEASGFLEADDARSTGAGIPSPERYLERAGAADGHLGGKDDASTFLSTRFDKIAGLDDFGVLRLEPTASASEVTAAFESIAPAYHPDRFRRYADPLMLRLAGRVFDRHVLAFYRILNPKKPSEPGSPETLRSAPSPAPAPLAALREAMIFDADSASARTFENVCRELGLETAKAATPEELRTIIAAATKPVDLVIFDVDLLMDLDGRSLEALAKFCKSGDTRCVGAFAENTRSRDPLFFTKFGIEGLVEKGTSPAEIRTRLGRLLEKRR